MRRLGRRKSKSRVLYTVIIIFAVCVVLYLIFAIRLLPVIKTMSVNNARNIATQTINNAAGKVLKRENISYDKLMTLEKNSNGAIIAVKADSLQIDLLKYEITNEAIKELNNIDPNELAIPIGTVIGGELFSGTGPRISVKIEPVGSVETSIQNDFTAAGINQTRQQVILNVKASITIIVSTYSATTDIKSNFTLADTIIVGSVPDYYTVVEDGVQGSGTSTANKVFTYGRNQTSSSK